MQHLVKDNNKNLKSKTSVLLKPCVVVIAVVLYACCIHWIGYQAIAASFLWYHMCELCATPSRFHDVIAYLAYSCSLFSLLLIYLFMGNAILKRSEIMCMVTGYIVSMEISGQKYQKGSEGNDQRVALSGTTLLNGRIL